MPKEILEQLFDSPVKVRILKLFLRNPEEFFGIKGAAKRIKSNPNACRRQINKLASIGLLKSRFKNKKRGYSVNQNFDFYKELTTLVLKSSPTSKKKLLGRLKKLGRIKLAIIAGTFLNTENARTDILVVGDNIRQKKLSNFLEELESDIGKEINYVVFTVEEFKYRYDMFDRFLRDILEKPHEKLINKLRI